MTNVINPLAVDDWIKARLLATQGATVDIHGQEVPADAVAFCGDPGDAEADPPVAPTIRAAAAREGFSPREFLVTGDSDESHAWPYILWSPWRDGVFDTYAQENVGLDAEYLVRSMMREDYADEDVERANWLGFIAIQAAFQGVAPGEHEASDGTNVTGIIHGCKIIRPHIKTSLPPNAKQNTPRVSEMGVVIRLFAT